MSLINESEAAMDIRVYLNNGDILDFSQNDPALAQGLLAEVQAGKLFPGLLILGSAATCTLLRPSSISRIDILTPTRRDADAVVRAYDAA
ncbi:MAG: hypothetical protein IPL58_05745 [Betaproteobacteria bacterium]|uniref:Uncharacterized protein n=1 Tax=Candidatus Proximibacter danicus TaxID=2954365 RepID=A0A9D7K2W1_9PROT|nr:hypothetical protein [Candidatus Proximibacter danicus]